MPGNASVLDRILNKKRGEVEALKGQNHTRDLRRQALDAPPARDFLAGLKNAAGVPVIAEIKKASPSAGTLKQDVDVAARAASYQAGGAAALSVLTDRPFFNGCLDDLTTARQAVSLPVLCKDFIIDPVQVHRARLAGADAVLLIVAALSPSKLDDLYAEAMDLNMTALIEVHNEAEIEMMAPLNPELVGINNRDLTTLGVSLDTALRLRPRIGPGSLVVGESGIKGPADIARLLAGGLDAFLVGTTLMKAEDPEAMLKSLCRAGAIS